MNTPQIIINKTEKASSYEFGKACNRFKLYFETPEDLKIEIAKLKALGLYADEMEEFKK